jgi:hypothetical protein
MFDSFKILSNKSQTMLYFHHHPFWKALEWNILFSFMPIGYTLWPFPLFHDNLGHFGIVGNVFPILVHIKCQQKSGNREQLVKPFWIGPGLSFFLVTSARPAGLTNEDGCDSSKSGNLNHSQ